MNYYYLNLESIPDFDEKTEYENFKPKNYGLEFSYFPFDEILVKDFKYFCTERLYFNTFNLDTAEKSYYLTGVKPIKPVRVTQNSNWLTNYPQAKPDQYIEIEIVGETFKDDLGILKQEINHEIVGRYNHEFLIGSERAVKCLILNHCPYIQGYKLDKNQINEISEKSNLITFDNKNWRLINQINDF